MQLSYMFFSCLIVVSAIDYVEPGVVWGVGEGSPLLQRLTCQFINERGTNIDSPDTARAAIRGCVLPGF